jgi:hypothetical protein
MRNRRDCCDTCWRCIHTHDSTFIEERGTDEVCQNMYTYRMLDGDEYLDIRPSSIPDAGRGCYTLRALQTGDYVVRC